MNSLVRMGLGLAVLACVGCGSSYKVQKKATAEGPNKPVAIVFDAPTSDKTISAQVATIGMYTDSFFVVADTEPAALAMIDVEKREPKPGVTPLGSLKSKEVDYVDIKVPAGKKFALVAYVVKSGTSGAVGKVDVEANLIEK